MSIVRRVFFYLVSIITLGILAAGVGVLLSLLFNVTIKSSLTQVGQPGFNRQQLSLGLAMVVIGGPLWFFFWRAVQRRVGSRPEEIGSAIRKFFLNLIILVTALTGVNAASEFLRWLLAGARLDPFSSGLLAIVIVSAAIWYYHWWVSETEGHPSAAARTLRRWYVYILSGFGLVWVAVGPVLLINSALASLPIWGPTIVPGQFWNAGVQMGLAWVVIGAPVWAFHWFKMARGDADSTLRQVYIYLLTIFGGSIAGLVALTTTVYQVLFWAFGGVTGPVAAHFRFLSWTVPTIVVAGAVWGYHQWVAREEAEQVHQRRFSAQRVHAYLMSFVGIGALISGVIMMVGVLLNLWLNAIETGPLVMSAGWWRGQLSLCLALLIVGTPLWLYYWKQVLERAEAGGVLEWRARSRRIFLYGLILASIVALAAALVNIVYQFLSGLFQGTAGAAVLRDSRWSLQALVVAAPVLWYHWRIARQDQRRGAEAAAVQKTVTLLAGETAGDLVSRLEDKLGFGIRRLYRVGQAPEDIPTLSDEDLGTLVTEIQAAPSTRVMLMVHGGKVLVVPYQDK